MIEIIINNIKKTFVFSGRSSRSEFAYYLLFILITLIYIIPYIFYITPHNYLTNYCLPSPHYLPSYCPIQPTIIFILLPPIIARRLHDTNYSAWNIIIFTFIILLSYFDIILRIAVDSYAEIANKPNGIQIASAITTISMFFPLLMLSCVKGTVGDNRFGKDPLQN